MKCLLIESVLIGFCQWLSTFYFDRCMYVCVSGHHVSLALVRLKVCIFLPLIREIMLKDCVFRSLRILHQSGCPPLTSAYCLQSSFFSQHSKCSEDECQNVNTNTNDMQWEVTPYIYLRDSKMFPVLLNYSTYLHSVSSLVMSAMQIDVKGLGSNPDWSTKKHFLN